MERSLILESLINQCLEAQPFIVYKDQESEFQLARGPCAKSNWAQRKEQGQVVVNRKQERDEKSKERECNSWEGKRESHQEQWKIYTEGSKSRKKEDLDQKFEFFKKEKVG